MFNWLQERNKKQEKQIDRTALKTRPQSELGETAIVPSEGDTLFMQDDSVQRWNASRSKSSREKAKWEKVLGSVAARREPVHVSKADTLLGLETITQRSEEKENGQFKDAGKKKGAGKMKNCCCLQ